ncbi:site-specific DNA-methyltransferase (cytosine-N4-specific) [Spinactinospora alkalitolerans]|uniref:Methyltransferase n=1 Tax=Spinactinospora alkalitolerans TaxID=687207 RepID=A0A852U3B9_9ACTN|nr:site-specific DNA-methyltransferase [Spinactinospora alkalitolerans]NYE49995.1 site-specific DNA-methyltransferase (cytosine-N4-specific) [Spinactinospora alkalitolerans]
MIAPAYDDGRVRLYYGDARTVLTEFPDASIDCVVTSPPYWRKRDYGVEGQYGLEETFNGYVDTLRSVFAEIHRVLTDRGTLWLNLGDSHIAAAPGPRTNPGALDGTPNSRTVPRGFGEKRGLTPKNLVGIPWRVAFALQGDGWILRSAIVWHKPNAMPESVTDRPATRYELLFLLVKQRSYFFDLDPIRQPHQGPRKRGSNRYTAYETGDAVGSRHTLDPGQSHHAQGRNPGDVWTLGTRPSRHGHHAGFPIDIPQRCIAAGCPPSGTVLDPFSGSGTTLVAARNLGRHGIGIDLQPAYHAIAVDRLAEEVEA